MNEAHTTVPSDLPHVSLYSLLLGTTILPVLATEPVDHYDQWQFCVDWELIEAGCSPAEKRAEPCCGQHSLCNTLDVFSQLLDPVWFQIPHPRFSHTYRDEANCWHEIGLVTPKEKQTPEYLIARTAQGRPFIRAAEMEEEAETKATVLARKLANTLSAAWCQITTGRTMDESERYRKPLDGVNPQVSGVYRLNSPLSCPDHDYLLAVMKRALFPIAEQALERELKDTIIPISELCAFAAATK